jgi:hypothetical protein
VCTKNSAARRSTCPTIEFCVSSWRGFRFCFVSVPMQANPDDFIPERRGRIFVLGRIVVSMCNLAVTMCIRYRCSTLLLERSLV